jgi:tetratricopeptide (TPR) repeat protein
MGLFGKKKKTAEEWFNLGYDAKDPEEALKCFDKALEIDPEYGRAKKNKKIAEEKRRKERLRRQEEEKRRKERLRRQEEEKRRKERLRKQRKEFQE